MHDECFWQHLEDLVAGSELVIDRPRASAHPRYPDLVYPLDYGYLQGTRAADGGGIDCWLGSLAERRLSGVIVTVDLHKRDSEIKLLLGCTEQESQVILAFHNSGSQAGLLLARPCEGTIIH